MGFYFETVTIFAAGQVLLCSSQVFKFPVKFKINVLAMYRYFVEKQIPLKKV